ncbi:MAG: ROK family protein [Fusicatenibacter sp.]|nr:ROK family protein [Fusicatenibacter sp.]
MVEKVIGAVDIGGTKIHVGIVDSLGNVLADQCFPTDADHQSGEEAMNRVTEILSDLCSQVGISTGNLRGIGVSCTGPVNIETGTVENPYTLEGWMGFPIVEDLSRRSGLEVRLENDANGALLGEVFQRNLRDQRVLMITLGTGIGVAFWQEGELYRAGKYHPEMGHIIVSSNGPNCYCGHKGCFESLCSGKAVNERAQEAGFQDFDEVYEKACSQEKTALELLNQILTDMKNGIWSLNVVFKPDTIILAGGFSKKYFSLIQDAVMEDCCGKEDFLSPFEMLPACGNQNSALVGANMLFYRDEKKTDSLSYNFAALVSDHGSLERKKVL